MQKSASGHRTRKKDMPHQHETVIMPLLESTMPELCLDMGEDFWKEEEEGDSNLA